MNKQEFNNKLKNIHRNIDVLERNYCCRYSKDEKLKILLKINMFHDKALELIEEFDKSTIVRFTDHNSNMFEYKKKCLEWLDE